MKRAYRYRSAITGRYVSAEYARSNPSTTVRETVKAATAAISGHPANATGEQ